MIPTLSNHDSEQQEQQAVAPEFPAATSVLVLSWRSGPSDWDSESCSLLLTGTGLCLPQSWLSTPLVVLTPQLPRLPAAASAGSSLELLSHHLSSATPAAAAAIADAAVAAAAMAAAATAAATAATAAITNCCLLPPPPPSPLIHREKEIKHTKLTFSTVFNSG